MKVTKSFKASEDGHTITEYSPGEYEELPPKALAHAQNIGALESEKPKTTRKNAAQKGPKNTKQVKK